MVFIKAVSPDGVRKLHQSARVDNPTGQSMLSVSSCHQEHGNSMLSEGGREGRERKGGKEEKGRRNGWREVGGEKRRGGGEK